MEESDASLEHHGMLMAMRRRCLADVGDNSHALARGSRTRLPLLEVRLGDEPHALARGSRSRLIVLEIRTGDDTLLLLPIRWVRGCQLPASEEVSAHGLAHGIKGKPLLLHLRGGQRSHGWVWIRDRSPLIRPLDGLSAHGALRLWMLIRWWWRVSGEDARISGLDLVCQIVISGRFEVEIGFDCRGVRHDGQRCWMVERRRDA